MKNALNYYYNINVETIRNVYNNFLFKSSGIKYMLKRVENLSFSQADFLNTNMVIRTQIPWLSEIVTNNVGGIITNINDSNYILFKLQINDNFLITDLDILKFNKPLNVNEYLVKQLDTSKWDDMWLNKIDYFEMYINENYSEHLDYLYVYNYYLGLAELAVSLFRDANRMWKGKDVLVVSHKRIKCKDTNIEFLDPTNIIMDNRVRDIAEYYKDQIIENRFEYQRFCSVITSMNLTKKEAQLLIARLLFPTYFFDKFVPKWFHWAWIWLWRELFLLRPD